MSLTAFMDPVSNGGTIQWTPSSGTNWGAANKSGTRQPTAPATTPTLTCATSSSTTDIYNMGTAPVISGTVASIVVWLNGAFGKTTSPTVQLKQSGSFLTAQTPTLGGSQTWGSVTFTPAGGFTQTDLNNMQLQLIAPSGKGGGGVNVYEVYMTFSYNPAGDGGLLMGFAGT